jgi:hypothetical protein
MKHGFHIRDIYPQGNENTAPPVPLFGHKGGEIAKKTSEMKKKYTGLKGRLKHKLASN